MTEREWKRIEDEAPPNDVFDVLARKWDAALDIFTIHRFAGCVQVNGAIIWGSPFFGDFQKFVLTEAGYRPVYWMPLPPPPKDEAP